MGVHFAFGIPVAVVEALNAAAARRVVLGHRDLHAGAVGELLGLLHQPLAKRFLSHHHGPVQILQGARDNLAGRSRRTVHEHHHRDVRKQRGAHRLVRLVPIGSLAFRADDLFALRHEQIHDGNGLAEQAATVAAKVKHNLRCPQRIGQVNQGFADLRPRRFCERAQGQIPRAVVQHAVVRDVGHFDFGADEVESEQPFRARSPNAKGQRRAGRTLEQFADLIFGQSLKVAPVHFLQNVAQSQARLFCRFAFQKVDHHGLAGGVGFHAGPNTSVFSGLHETDVFHFGFGEVPGVRIQLRQHGLNARFHQFSRGEFVHVIDVQFAERRLHDFELFGHLEIVVFDGHRSQQHKAEGCCQPHRQGGKSKSVHAGIQLGVWGSEGDEGCSATCCSNERTTRFMCRWHSSKVGTSVPAKMNTTAHWGFPGSQFLAKRVFSTRHTSRNNRLMRFRSTARRNRRFPTEKAA